MIGIVGGTILLERALLEAPEARAVSTEAGEADVDLGRLGGIDVAFIQRHGRRRDRPPHRIPHAANFLALRALGVRRVLALASTGCLRPEVRLPALLVPHDYMSFQDATIFDRSLEHVTPGFDDQVRAALLEEARRDGRLPVLERGVYFQTRGPRLETRAEVAWLKGFADCVGMTVASEATVARECGLAYAALCSLDNYAHGLVDEPLDHRTIQANAARVADVCVAIVAAAARRLEP
jgi:5'-methylthioadenosine phosphorylase